jgi:23S rRNA (cytosine1962-C5)-methyltransferase
MPSEHPVVHLASDELPAGPWVFARQVRLRGAAPADGSLVEVHDETDRFVAHGLFNSASDIRVRLVSRGRRAALDRPREFLLKTLKSADVLRRRVLRIPDHSDAYRVAHAEGDDLPGLIVDRLGPVLVCEYHALGFYNLHDDVAWALGQLYPGFPVVRRFPKPAARAEGVEGLATLPQADGATSIASITLREHGVPFEVLPAGGHKTGWFCDQRENRLRVARLCAGRSVLDLFCNHGGFALQAVAAGARSVTAVDLDEVVLERARRSAALTGATVDWIHADAFDHLREVRASAKKPDVIVVDPHKLIVGKANLEVGQKKYLDLNALALEAVRPGGLVATFSCSGLLAEPAFLGLVFQAARRADRGVRLLEKLGAGPDHPQRPDFVRSRYLKGALLAVD